MSTQATNFQDGKDRKSCEVRFGLVMYGGVSLAIYINGVAQEFFRAVRGRGVFKLIKALTDSDVVVDIISGTSAGGINGIMLAYALCNNKDFRGSSTLWRRDGDIRALLRTPSGKMDGTSSLLNSEGYYQPRLEEAFRYMPQYVREAGEMGSEFTELDLFVTGTDVDGRVSTQFDDAGHPIDVKDHRAVFHLKHRRGRKEPFNPTPFFERTAKADTTYRALAKLARITSCFPAAFEPVRVANDKEGEDGRLQEWGRLGKECCFLDGGVIDNKPFTYTLREIFHRASTRKVDRKLFYVEPDPEHFTTPEVATQPDFARAIIASLIGIPGYESIADDLKLLANHNTKVKRFRRLTSSLSQSTSYNPPAGLVKELYRQSRLISISDRVVQGLLKVDGKDELLEPNVRQAASCLVREFDELLREAGGGTDKILYDFDVYFRLRRLFRIAHLIESKIYREAPPNDDAKLVEHQARLKIYRDLWGTVNRVIALLEIVRVRMEELIDHAPIEWKLEIEKSLGQREATNKPAREVWDMVQKALRRLLDIDQEIGELLPQPLNDSYDKHSYKNFIEAVASDPALKAGEAKWLEQSNLSAFSNKLKDKAKRIEREVREGHISAGDEAGPNGTPAPRKSRNLLCVIDKYERALFEASLRDPKDEVWQAYKTFESLDARLFPIELTAELHEKDLVETIRISPRDAEKGFSNKGLSDKVSGDALYHFAGFFKRSWRSNDILWGRLDGLCQLIETLLAHKRVAELVRTSEGRQRVRAHFFDVGDNDALNKWKPSMEPAALFPRAGKMTQGILKQWLEHLLSENDDTCRAALKKEEFEDKVALIIEAAQLEVIQEELPNVINDSLAEQARWNQFHLSEDEREQIVTRAERDTHRAQSNGTPSNGAAAPGGNPRRMNPFAFEPAKGSLDPFAAIIAAAGRGQTVMKCFEEGEGSDPPTPAETRLGQFFKHQYQVGAEKLLEHMPRLILMEILAVSLLVLRNCILGVFGDKAEKVRSSPLYLFGVDYPLRAFYGAVLFLRRAPNYWVSVQVGAFIFSVLALVIGTLWWSPIIYEKSAGFSIMLFMLFIVAPLTILFAQSYYFWRQRKVSNAWWGAFWMGVFALLAAAVLSPLLLVVIAFAEVAIEEQGRIVSSIQKRAFIANNFSEEHTNMLAQYGLGIAFLLTLAACGFGYYLMIRLGHRGRPKPKQLKRVLIDSFSFDEMSALADRLVASALIAWRELNDKLTEYLSDPVAKPLLDKLEKAKAYEWGKVKSIFADYFGSEEMNLFDKKYSDADVMTSSELEQLCKHYLFIEAVPAVIERRLWNLVSTRWQEVEKVLRDYFESDHIDLIKQSLWRDTGLRRDDSISSSNGELPQLNEHDVQWVVAEIEGGRITADQNRLVEKLKKRLAGLAQVRWVRVRGVVAEQVAVSQVASMMLGKVRLAPRVEFARLKPVLKDYIGADGMYLLEKHLAGRDALPREEWRKLLEEHLSIEEVTRRIAKTLTIPSSVDDDQTVNEKRKALAADLVRWAEKTGNITRLETQMGFCNPEAMQSM